MPFPNSLIGSKQSNSVFFSFYFSSFSIVVTVLNRASVVEYDARVCTCTTWRIVALHYGTNIDILPFRSFMFVCLCLCLRLRLTRYRYRYYVDIASSSANGACLDGIWRLWTMVQHRHRHRTQQHKFFKNSVWFCSEIY